MKPKLIILNGPCGVGKTTLAEIYKDEHPLTLSLDVDDVRRFMGSYKEYQEKSREQMYRLAFVMAEEHLKNGYDVIVPNLIRDVVVLEKFENIAKKLEASFCELVLWTTKDDAIARAIKRGFKANGLLQEDKLEKQYDELMETLQQRKDVVYIESAEGGVEKSYSQLINSIKI